MTYNILQSANFQQMSYASRVMLVNMYMNHPLNENFNFSYDYAKKLNCSGNCTRFYERIQELINAGFISVVKQGSRGVPTVYCFSDKWYKDKRVEVDNNISNI